MNCREPDANVSSSSQLIFAQPLCRAMVASLRVLHVAGSPVSQYYSMISVHYARQMLAGSSDEATKASFEFTFAVVLPGGAWCIVPDLDQGTIDDAPKLEHGAALSTLAASDFDVCVPHMFCWPGYTQYRSIFDLIGVPLVGNTAECMALITDKQQTKAVAAAAGVPVPPGELLHSPDQALTSPLPPSRCCSPAYSSCPRAHSAAASHFRALPAASRRRRSGTHSSSSRAARITRWASPRWRRRASCARR